MSRELIQNAVDVLQGLHQMKLRVRVRVRVRVRFWLQGLG